MDQRSHQHFTDVGVSLNEAVHLVARRDPREVIADPHARYFGAELGERSLIPTDSARLGEISLQEWLGQPALVK